MIISVSRRCDIPRFQFDWFMERLGEGFVDVANPFNAAQVRRISLLSADAQLLVFWTRDPRAILARVEELENRFLRFYTMVTITGYPAVLEPNVPAAEIICAAVAELAHKTGNRWVIWRYDPILLSTVTDADFHRKNFSSLAAMLNGSVRRVIVSLYDDYKGARQRLFTLEKSGLLTLTYTEDIHRLLADLAKIARANGMEMQTCAEAADFENVGIKPGACIDGELACELLGIEPGGLEPGGRDKNQRDYCLCAKSVDIGHYSKCPAGCVYCYAW